jgi:transcriptional regulator with XRE-family HTH domain
MNRWLKELGRRLRERRKELGLTVGTVGERSKLRQCRISDLELGKTNAAFSVLCQLAPALESDLGTLLRDIPLPAGDAHRRAGDETGPAPGSDLGKVDPAEIRNFRHRQGMTQQEMARLCGVSQSSITHWERGGEISGAASLALRRLLDGGGAVPLSRNEEQLLDEAVKRGGYQNREDFLTSSLLKIVRSRAGDSWRFNE